MKLFWNYKTLGNVVEVVTQVTQNQGVNDVKCTAKVTRTKQTKRTWNTKVKRNWKLLWASKNVVAVVVVHKVTQKLEYLDKTIQFRKLTYIQLIKKTMGYLKLLKLFGSSWGRSVAPEVVLQLQRSSWPTWWRSEAKSWTSDFIQHKMRLLANVKASNLGHPRILYLLWSWLGQVEVVMDKLRMLATVLASKSGSSPEF